MSDNAGRLALPTGDADRAFVERWRVVEERPGYEVSDAGRVRSVDRVRIDRNGRQVRYRARMLTPVPGDARGHLRVCLGRENQRIVFRYVHRLVLEAFVGPQPDGCEGLHGVGGIRDNRLVNLRWGTRSENCYDRGSFGADRNRAKEECPRGHPLSDPNLVASHRKLGHRKCLACSRAQAHVQRYPNADFSEHADRYYAEIALLTIPGGQW